MTLVGLLGRFSGSAQVADDLLGGSVSFRNVKIPIFLAAEREPALIVQMERMSTDYERKGFFRIGVLPVMVLEGVTFDIRQAESLTNGLVSLRRWLGPKAANRLEFRRVTIQAAGPGSGQLKAGRMRVLPEGAWELDDGVCLNLGTNQIQVARATFQVAGERTGALLLGAAPHRSTNFFAIATANLQSNNPP